MQFLKKLSYLCDKGGKSRPNPMSDHPERNRTMKEIRYIDLTRLSNGAHFLFVHNILVRAEGDESVAAKAAPQTAALRAALAREEAAMRISSKSLLTDDIARADRERGALYMAYKKAVRGMSSVRVEGMHEAAVTLLQHLKDFGISPRMQLDRETGLLSRFVEDLEGKHAAHVRALSLVPVVTRLKEANERVRTLTLRRTDDRAAKETGAMRKARAATDKAYAALVKRVNGFALVEGDGAGLSDFIDYADAEVLHYKREASGRRSRPAPAAADADADAPPPPSDTPQTAADPEADIHETCPYNADPSPSSSTET